MNSLDLLIIVILGVAAVYGFFRGLIREVFSLLGIITGFIVATRYHHLLAQYLMHWITSGIIAAAIAFIFCFVFAIMVAGMVGSALRAAARHAHLGTQDHMLGSIFGLFKGVILVTFLLLTAGIFLSADHPVLAHSKLFPYFVRLGDQVLSIIPQEWKDSITTRQDESMNHGQRQNPVTPEDAEEPLEDL